MVFRAGHQPEIAPLRRAGTDKARLKRHQMDIGDGRLAHRRRIDLKHAAIGKETSNFREDSGTFQQIGNGCARLPACRFAHGDDSLYK